MARGGCIIRSVFLNQIKNAYDNDKHLSNLLMDPFFNKVINKSQDSWRAVMKEAISFGIPTPAMSSALHILMAINLRDYPLIYFKHNEIISSSYGMSE